MSQQHHPGTDTGHPGAVSGGLLEERQPLPPLHLAPGTDVTAGSPAAARDDKQIGAGCIGRIGEEAQAVAGTHLRLRCPGDHLSLEVSAPTLGAA
jgi:hypothetical protein